jgi:hypothetical protein
VLRNSFTAGALDARELRESNHEQLSTFVDQSFPILPSASSPLVAHGEGKQSAADTFMIEVSNHSGLNSMC